MAAVRMLNIRQIHSSTFRQCDRLAFSAASKFSSAAPGPYLAKQMGLASLAAKLPATGIPPSRGMAHYDNVSSKSPGMRMIENHHAVPFSAPASVLAMPATVIFRTLVCTVVVVLVGMTNGIPAFG